MIKRHIALSFAVVFVAPALAGTARADGPGVAGQDLLYLLHDCSAAGKNQGQTTDCYQSLSGLQDALWGASGIASAQNPVIVLIGVGDFSGTLTCPDGKGYVTFRGAGRERTRLVHPGPPQFGLPTLLTVTNCDALEFQDLSLVNQTTGSASFPVGVFWHGGGSSTWTNVFIEAGYTTWLDDDTACDPEDQPIHYFFGSRLISTGSYGYYARCGQHWFYGSEIRMEAKVEAVITPQDRRGVAVDHLGLVEIFGGSVRVFADPAFTLNADFLGAVVGQASNGGAFHMHGGIISVNATGPGRDAVGIDAVGSQSLAHVVDTAFVLKKGSGSAVRIRGPGTVQSPFLWQAGPQPPVAGLVSADGQDAFVETDCGSDGDCDGGGSQAHLMIYDDDACAGPEPWFDTATRRCRNDTSDPVAAALSDLDSRVTALENP